MTSLATAQSPAMFDPTGKTRDEILAALWNSDPDGPSTPCTRQDEDACSLLTWEHGWGKCECGYVGHDIPRDSDNGHDELCPVLNPDLYSIVAG